MTQSIHTEAEDLIGRLQEALAGTHGRDFSVAAVRSLVSMEVGEWNSERDPQPIKQDFPLISHKIRLTSE
ncbi:hypothetical protein [Rhizobium sp. CECT 9324]|uniref:hypothetical protein n=1 Tax=Rhizobium sp. CECT 9324 TaxID=2845820 RepID=UPI001E5C13DE|nr:hypothetical protein [Rhizobium sp. CECT 9324]CAH0342096.1 hypothetical protein RHI9324_03806 [Rhizobium sp. CECT 9324]